MLRLKTKDLIILKNYSKTLTDKGYLSFLDLHLKKKKVRVKTGVEEIGYLEDMLQLDDGGETGDKNRFDEYKNMCTPNKLNKNEDEHSEIDLHVV